MVETVLSAPRLGAIPEKGTIRMSALKYWLGFNLVKGIGPAKVQAMLDYFGSLETAWRANKMELARLGFDRRTLKSFLKARRELDLEQQMAALQKAGVQLLTWESAAYPKYLREAPNAPPVLYMRGEIDAGDRLAVAVVGTRRLTTYGRQIARQLASQLAANGVTIVSGLARGIDAIAHKAALASGGRTIAVLGSGLDHIYPAEHRPLVDQIVKNGQGAVLTEYALGTPPDGSNFPPRNRVISGLSLGVIVVEAGERSGALITADFALEQGREVFAIPGYVTSPASKGTNRLIQQGAKLVMDVDDVLDELNLSMVVEQKAVQLALPETAEEAALYAELSQHPTHMDELCRSTGLPTSLVSSTLTMMELKGMVQQVGNMNYVRAREPDPAYNIDED